MSKATKMHKIVKSQKRGKKDLMYIYREQIQIEYHKANLNKIINLVTLLQTIREEPDVSGEIQVKVMRETQQHLPSALNKIMLIQILKNINKIKVFIIIHLI